MAYINDQEIQKLAKLSAVALPAAQAPAMADMVQSVLTYADSLSQIGTHIPTQKALWGSYRTCWMRADDVHAWHGVSLLDHAPGSDGIFFIVPVIIK